MLKKLAIGVSDFKKLIQSNCYFVDKSLFIKEVLEDGSDVTLIPRPRRFGKTLNLSMLRYFFDLAEEENLFEDLNIWKHEECRQYRGLYPVIYITLKDTKADNYADCIYKLKQAISNEFSKFEYLVNSPSVNTNQKKIIQKLSSGEAPDVEFESSLALLTAALFQHHKQKPILLIDEYDVPLQSGFTYDFYDKIIGFIRNFLSTGLKDNTNLRKAVITGILRVSKDSVFSGLNNLSVNTIIDLPYSDKFGLLENEVIDILNYYGNSASIDDVRLWYNGYIFGKSTIYNPWSIINFIYGRKETPEPYWVNTSSNDIIKSLLQSGSGELKEDLEVLMQGGSIIKEVNTNIVMSDVSRSANNIWNFMLFLGYLKPVNKIRYPGEVKIHYELKIPNLEVSYLFETVISSWCTDNLRNNEFEVMINALLTGDFKLFNKIFANYAVSAFSYFDTAGESEKTYHAFVLGMLVSLSKTKYSIKSNRESGYGRYDVMIIPKDITKNAVILEFKKVDRYDKETLKSAIESAFVQMEEKNYKHELKDLGFANIFEVAIAIDGKKSLAEGRRV